MRFAINRQPGAQHQQRWTSLARWSSVVALAVGSALATGCNSFIDPSELTNPPTHKQLPVPILRHLDTGVEEPNLDFASAQPPRAEDLVPGETDYLIGPNDFLAITLTDLQGPNIETIKQVRVTNSGNISLPLIGQVKAGGLTEAQLEAAIQQAYKDANIIQAAQVSVTTLETRNRTFSIIGAVNAPGEYLIVRSNFRVLDALTTARDTTAPIGIKELYVLRHKDHDQAGTTNPTQPTSPDLLAPRSQAKSRHPLNMSMQDAAQPAAQQPQGDQKTITLDNRQVQVNSASHAAPAEQQQQSANAAAAMDQTTQPNNGGFEFNEPAEPNDVRVIRIPLVQLKQGELKYNIVIRPGDTIVVPYGQIGEYYMGGHVARVGVYTLTGRDVTLTQAVISAGMLDQVAIPSRTEIVRRLNGQDKQIHARVDLAKVFAGQEPDIYLKPDDEVLVGTNALAPFIAAIRNGFRITYGFGFLYDRNYWEDNNP